MDYLIEDIFVTEAEDTLPKSRFSNLDINQLKAKKAALEARKAELLAYQNDLVVDNPFYQEEKEKAEKEIEQIKQKYNAQVIDRELRYKQQKEKDETEKRIENQIKNKTKDKTINDYLFNKIENLDLSYITNGNDNLSNLVERWWSYTFFDFVDSSVYNKFENQCLDAKKELDNIDQEKILKNINNEIRREELKINNSKNIFFDTFENPEKATLNWTHPKTGRTYKVNLTQLEYESRLRNHYVNNTPLAFGMVFSRVLKNIKFYIKEKNSNSFTECIIKDVFRNSNNELVLSYYTDYSSETQYLYLAIFINAIQTNSNFIKADSDLTSKLTMYKFNSSDFENNFDFSDSEELNDLYASRKQIESIDLKDQLLKNIDEALTLAKEINTEFSADWASIENLRPWKDYNKEDALTIYRDYERIQSADIDSLIKDRIKRRTKIELKRLNAELKEIDEILRIRRIEFKKGNGEALVNFFDNDMSNIAAYANIPQSQKAFFWGWLCKHITELSVTVYETDEVIGKSKLDFETLFGKDAVGYKTKGNSPSDWDAPSGYLKVDSASNIPGDVQQVFNALTSAKYILSRNNTDKETGRFIGNKLESVELVYYILRHYSKYGFILGQFRIEPDEAYNFQKQEFPNNQKEFDAGYNLN